MTNEELKEMKEKAIEYFKFHRKIFCEDHLKTCPKDSIAYQVTLKEKEFYDMAIKALETVEEFEKAQIITGGRLNGRTYAYKCGLEDGKRKALEQEQKQKIKVLNRDEAIKKLGTVDIYQASAWVTLLNDLEHLGLKICEVEE